MGSCENFVGKWWACIQCIQWFWATGESAGWQWYGRT